MAKRNPKPRIPDIGAVLARAREVAFGVMDKEVGRWAENEKSAFVARIRAQEFPSFRTRPLRSWYIAKKRRLRLSTKTMIATGHYLSQIIVHRSVTSTQQKRVNGRFASGHQDTGVRYVVGVPDDVMAVDMHNGKVTKTPLQQVIRTHEYGSSARAVPARPHWWPTFMEMKQQRAPVVRRSLIRKIRRAWHSARILK